MIFRNDAHRAFYEQRIEELQVHSGRKADCYLQALVYTLGICDDTRKRFDDMYDKAERSIIPGTIYAAWQTDGSRKTTRLAFNLFTGRTPTALTYDEASNKVTEDFDECRKYSVSDIFCCGFAPYFVEAIKIRYPEYM